MTQTPLRTVEVACRDDLRDTLAAIGRALDFGSHYGRNLDALVDCLRDLEAPTELVLVDAARLAAHDPEGLDGLSEALDIAVAERDEQPGLLELRVRYPPTGSGSPSTGSGNDQN